MRSLGVYTYRAARQDGAIAIGEVEASDRAAAAALLAARGLYPIEVGTRDVGSVRRHRLPHTDCALGLRLLATLLQAGLPMARALHTLDDVAPPSWRPLLPPLREAVRDGQSLAGALDSLPIDMPPAVIGMIRAGEAGAGVAPAVRRAAELMESVAATRSAIRSALAYPLILGVAGALSVGLLVGIVLPRFDAILSDLGQSLPPITWAVMAAAELVRMAAMPALISAAAVALVWHSWTDTSSGLEQWHDLLLHIPVVGSLRMSSATARVTGALQGLLESGVPLSAALRHGAAAGGDAALAARLIAARESIIAGAPISATLESHRALTPTAIRLIHGGEESGRLAEMLGHAALLESERAERQVRTLARLLEPALIIAFGAVVALVAAALLQAVYSVRPAP